VTAGEDESVATVEGSGNVTVMSVAGVVAEGSVVPSVGPLLVICTVDWRVVSEIDVVAEVSCETDGVISSTVVETPVVGSVVAVVKFL
jgi:hypothetical protein